VTACCTQLDAPPQRSATITIRYDSRLHHIGLSNGLRGMNVTVLADNLDIRVLDRDTGQPIRKLIRESNPLVYQAIYL
jgi:hypothetical protein